MNIYPLIQDLFVIEFVFTFQSENDYICLEIQQKKIELQLNNKFTSYLTRELSEEEKTYILLWLTHNMSKNDIWVRDQKEKKDDLY